jgi:hypothetical protein
MRETLEINMPDRLNTYTASMWPSVFTQQHDTRTEQSTMFSSDGWSHVIPKETRLRGTGECVPL